MSFNIYLAGQANAHVDKILMKHGVNRLYSQLNDRKLGQEWLNYSAKEKHVNIFVDSGAFSVHTKGKEVDVDEYIQYVNSYPNAFQAIAQVDKIPGEFGKPKTLEQLEEAPKASWENYLYMRERVNDKDCLLPIFHQGEDFKWLRNMLEWVDKDGNHIPYIGISPANDVATKHKEAWFATVFKVIKESSNPTVKTHAFGMTSLPLLERYPFYSADSTSWVMTSANGGIMTPWGIIATTANTEQSPNHYIKCDEHKQRALDNWLASMNITYEECRTQYTTRWIVNAMYLMEWASNYEFKGNNRFQKRLF